MRRKSFVFAALAAALVLGLAGCGSNRDSGGDATTGTVGDFGTDDAGVLYVGADTCIGCHEDFTWSSDAVEKFLAGAHVIHSDHITAASGSECLGCHDPIGDGRTLEALIDPADVPATGLAAVTCENCHGAGGEHYGVGPMPNPTPDYTACGTCHDALPESHLPHHPEADNIVTDWMNGGHFANENSHNSNVCSKCHTDEGARLYVDIDNVARLETVVLAVPSPSHPIQCRTCHDSHSPGELLEPAVTSGSNRQSAEYHTCTNCHQAHDAEVGTTKYTLAGSTSTDGASLDGELIYHATRWNRIITTTHYDDPATPTLVEGYNMDKTNERACRDCHNVHAADVTINEQWAESGHGGEILAAKLDAASGNLRTIDEVIAVKAAGSDGTLFAWGHYDWDATDSRGSCQVCHTATGIKNYLMSPSTYDSTGAGNDFSYLDGWAKDPDTGAVTSSGQNELLYCWGCHDNNSGELRNPGALTLVDSSDVVMGTLPDLGNSNLCTKCHGGRGNNDSIRNATSRSSRFAGHHAPTAGTVFSDILHIAYEFDGQNYANVAYFAHDSIGLNADSPETGSGPCASCHMPDSNHTFAAVVEDETTGEITEITNQALCNTCHSTYPMTPAILEEEKVGFNDAVVLFGNYITNVETNYLDTNINTNYATVPFEAYGAFQNWKYMGDDPCSYVHNRYYAKRIIFDSLDWLDNGALDGTITIDATTYPGAAEWLGADETTGEATRP